MSEFKVHQFNPISIFESCIEVKDTWIDFAKKTSYQRMSSDNGYFTEDKYVLDKLPDLKEVIKFQFELYARKWFKIKSHIKFDFQNSWINKHQSKDFAHNHSHVNSMFSGVYYLQHENDMGNITFQTPPYDNPVTKGFLLEFEEMTSSNCCEYTIQPKTGSLVIFPSHLVHSVGENLSNDDRYSLAFNLMFKDCEWGEMESRIKF